jgi:hypothetical protein
MKIGDKVIYVGDNSPYLKGETGIVIDFYSSEYGREDLPCCHVQFNDHLYRGVYLKNVKLLSKQLDFSFTENKNVNS